MSGFLCIIHLKLDKYEEDKYLTKIFLENFDFWIIFYF